MTVTDQEIRALAFLAKASRPNGAARWDEAGIVAAITKVRDRSLPTVVMAVIRAASDRDVESPGVIPSNGSHWKESAAVTSYTPQIIDKADRCGICSKHRSKCAAERVADDDHEFDDGRRPEVDVKRTVAALKDNLAPIAPPPTGMSLDARLAAIPAEKRDPGLEAVREQLRAEVVDA